MAVTLVVTISDNVRLAQPAVAAPKPAAPSTPLERKDEAAALVTARMTGRPVLITGMTTEMSEYVAQPNGSIELTTHTAPVHVRQGDRWVPVDLNLSRSADGSIRPKAHPEGLVIAGKRSATSGALATLGAGTQQVAMGWTGELPEPVIEGDKATYLEVLPEVDLVVEATRTGFEQFVVVKSRAAARRVATLKLPVTGKSVASHERDNTGAFVLKNAKGRAIVTSPTPLMWDAQIGPDGETPKRRTPVKSAVAKRAARAAASGRTATPPGVDFTLTPDLAWIDDPATVFPVTIDPQIAVATTFDTYIKDGDSADHGGANDLQLGLLSGSGGKRTRSLVTWDTTALRGKQITAATAQFYNWYSTTCAANSWEIWSTNAANSDTRWSNQPSWLTKEATSTQTKGFNSSCNDGWVSITATSFFQRAATANQTRGYMGIRATNESATSAFKQFRSRNADDNAQVPKATVTYNSYPVVGARSTVPPTVCAASTARPFINTATPQLKAAISDAEKSSVKASFEWHTTGGSKIGGLTTAAAASGSTLTAQVPAGALANNGTYSWRVQGTDGTVSSPWSSWCEFTVDTTSPAKGPTASSTTYPQGQFGGGAGTPGSFVLGANGVTDVAAYVYSLDVNPPTTVVTAPTLGSAVTVSVTPAAEGMRTLYVRSRDRAGNLSAVTAYHFNVGAGAINSPVSGDLSAGAVVLDSLGKQVATGLRYEWRRGDADAWVAVPAGDVSTVEGGNTVTWPQATSGGGAFPKLNWDVESTVKGAEDGVALDGPVQVRATFSGGVGAVNSDPVKFTLDRDRASAPSTEIGPGSVNGLTGNLTVSQADAQAPGGLGVTRVYNSRQADVVDPLFGPGWTAGLGGSDSDLHYTSLTATSSLVQVALEDGASLGFAKQRSTATEVTYKGEDDAADLSLTYAVAADTYSLRDVQGNVVSFTKVAGALAGRYLPTRVVSAGSADQTTVSWEKVSVNGAEIIRPTRVLAAVPSGVTCGATPARGCRALTYDYAATTTASGPDGFGDFAGRLTRVSFTAWDSDAKAMASVVLAAYAYDGLGRLVGARDPRVDNSGRGLWTRYGYAIDNTLSSVTPPGQAPWQLAYRTTPVDPGKGRLSQVSRLTPSGASAKHTVVYNVALTGSGAPRDMSAAAVARWGQTRVPVDATAVFSPQQVPEPGSTPESWERATVVYFDGNARMVDSLTPGGDLEAVWYDDFGNEIRRLAAPDLRRALDADPADSADAETELAERYSTRTVYNPSGTRVVESFGPEQALLLADGGEVLARDHTVFRYDEGAPQSEEPFNLVTTQTVSGQYYDASGATVEADSRTTKTTYDWALQLPLTVTEDPAGAKLVTRTKYNSAGQVISESAPAGGDSDDTPRTRVTVYYSAAANSASPDCGGRPEWAGAVCLVGPAGTAPASAPLKSTLTTYDMFLQPRTSVERAKGGAVLRTTTTTYDKAARPSQISVSTAADLGEKLPAQRMQYDPDSGQLLRTQSVDESGTVLAEVIRGYDNLGQMTSYTDADGNTTTSTFDVLGRPVQVKDGKVTRTYAYDEGELRRGLPTSVTDSVLGRFSAAYDANGELTRQSWPNGVQVDLSTDGQLTYTKPGCGQEDCTLYTESAGLSVHGQWLTHASDLSAQSYGYDGAGRMTEVADTADGDCTTRRYSYDAATNRTKATTFAAGEAGECQSDTANATSTWEVDSADRMVNTGYRYDSLGRTLSLPVVDSGKPQGSDLTIGYHANDMVRSITQGDRLWKSELDVINNRIRSWQDSTSASVKKTNHYAGDGDSPSWTDEGNGGYSRAVDGVAGIAAVHTDGAPVTWVITNLHGDFVAGISPDGLGLSSTGDFTENGLARSGTDAASNRYGWHGASQRAADTPGGVVLMGARAYSPGTGRFLTADPLYGGNSNDYEYCSGDPMACEDTSGMRANCNGSYYSYNSDKTSRGWTWAGVYVITRVRTTNFQARCKMGTNDAWKLMNALDGLRGAALTVFTAVISAALCSNLGGAAAITCGLIGAFASYYISAKAPGGYASWYGNCHRGDPRGLTMSATIIGQKVNTTRIIPTLYRPIVYNSSWSYKWYSIPRFKCR